MITVILQRDIPTHMPYSDLSLGCLASEHFPSASERTGSPTGSYYLVPEVSLLYRFNHRRPLHFPFEAGLGDTFKRDATIFLQCICHAP